MSQQVIQKVGKIDLNAYRLDTSFPSNRDVSVSHKKKTSSGNLREVEWETDTVQKRKSNRSTTPIYSRQSRERPFNIGALHGSRLLGERKCQYCVPTRQLQHYHSMNCTASFSRECDCAKYYRCPKPTEMRRKHLPVVDRDYCEYNGKRFEVNDMIPIDDQPCKVCQCRRIRTNNKQGLLFGAEIDCSAIIECPELAFGLEASSDKCYFAYEHDKCCGSEVSHVMIEYSKKQYLAFQVCPDQMSGSDVRRNLRCNYDSKVYRWGEEIVLKDNPCLRCICDQNWNDFDPESSRSCRKYRCDSLEQKETAGCTPIYTRDSCCPVDYVCGKQNEQPVALITTHTCMFDRRQLQLNERITFNKQSTLYRNVCANCTCLVPPLLTCHHDPRCGVDNLVLSI